MTTQGNTHNDYLVREQFRMLTQQIPLLHCLILMCVVPFAVAFHGRTPFTFSVVLPLITILFSGSRVVQWMRAARIVDEMPDDKMQAAMRHSRFMAAVFTGALAIAYVVGIRGLGEYEQAVCLTTVWIGAVAGGFCTFALPVAAISIIGAATAVTATHFLLSGNVLIITTGALLCMIACVMVGMVRKISASFNELVTTRALVGLEQIRTAEARDAATRLANSDFLTGLANRRHFVAELERRVSDRDAQFAVAMIDLNGFKPINDTFGHAVGDETLVEVGRRLERALGNKGLVARLGGDEFALLLHDIANEDDALTLGRSIIETLSKPLILSTVTVRLSGGCGLALHSHARGDAEKLMHLADTALYSCKSREKGAAAVHRDAADDMAQAVNAA